MYITSVVNSEAVTHLSDDNENSNTELTESVRRLHSEHVARTTFSDGFRHAFVIDTSPFLGPYAYSATQSLHGGSRQGWKTAVVIREYGTSKVSKVQLFMHCMQS